MKNIKVNMNAGMIFCFFSYDFIGIMNVNKLLSDFNRSILYGKYTLEILK